MLGKVLEPGISECLTTKVGCGKVEIYNLHYDDEPSSTGLTWWVYTLYPHGIPAGTWVTFEKLNGDGYDGEWWVKDWRK